MRRQCRGTAAGLAALREGDSAWVRRWAYGVSSTVRLEKRWKPYDHWRLAALITLRTVAVGPTISVLHKQVTKCRLTSHTEGCENKFSSDSPSYSQPPLVVGTHISQGWLRRRENGCGRSGGRFERGFSSQSSGAGVQPGPGQVVEHKLEQLAVIVTNHSLRDNMRLHKDKSFLLRQNCRKRQQFHLWNISC